MNEKTIEKSFDEYMKKNYTEKNWDMEVNEIMEAVRRMRTYQKKAAGKRNDYQFQDARRQAEKEVDRLIKEWEDQEFHKRQTQLF